MAVHLQGLGVETRPVVGHFDAYLAGGAGHRYPLIATGAVAKTVGQRFLQHSEQRDPHRQWSRLGGVVQGERHGDAGFALMVCGGALQGLGQGKQLDFRQLQAAQYGAQVGERGLERKVHRAKIFAHGAASADGMLTVSASVGECLDAHGRQCQPLARPVVQIRGDIAQELFIQRHGAGGGAIYPFVELRVLLQQRSKLLDFLVEFPLRRSDGVICLPYQSREQREHCQGYRAVHAPAAQLRGAHALAQTLGGMKKSRDRQHRPVAVGAQRTIGLDQA